MSKAQFGAAQVANILTISRLVLAPLFFVLCMLPQWLGSGGAGQGLGLGSGLGLRSGFGLELSERALQAGVFPILVLLYLYMEASDLADGYIARRSGVQSEMGKLLDPFADVICRISYFSAFAALGIMPLFAFLLILYREFTAGFLRSVLASRGRVFAAQLSGKIKGLLYSFTSMFGLYLIAVRWGFVQVNVPTHAVRLSNISTVIFYAVAAFAWYSCIQYIFMSHIGKKEKPAETA